MINLSSIGQSFKNSFKSIRTPAQILSTVMMLCAMGKRPGLSCMLSTSNILQDLSKSGIPTGPLPDGSPNLMNELVSSVVCEVFRAMKEDLNIQIIIPPGTISVVTNGANAGGPVVSTGVNVNSPVGEGYPQ
jgi:hypothetical protein